MAGKKSKSQWDFGGELFPVEPTVATPPPAAPEPAGSAPPAVVPVVPVVAPAGRRILSVSELTAQVRGVLENEIGTVWVTGEVTNLRVQSSGHRYFTLKDAGSQLSCVLFRAERVEHRDLLEDGQKVLLSGEVTVYEARGQYQLIVRRVELQGVGALQIAFEKLKQKLAAEGLFAAERKRPLPEFPQRIGIVTSPTGAAIRDVLHVVRRRNPGLEIILAPCRVQGEGAGREIAAAIRMLNEYNAASEQSNSAAKLDIILVTRGGGSLEDLWAFNEEIVARAVYESALPIVSGVGHEIDFSITDFVADLRAATPSAAAELITEGVFSSQEFIADAPGRLRQLLEQHLDAKTDELAQMNHRLTRLHPRRRLNDGWQLLDDLQIALGRGLKLGARQNLAAFQQLTERLARLRPAQLLRQRREIFEQAHARLEEQLKHRVRELRNQASGLEARLRLLGPEQVLARGYSITRDAETGKVLRDAAKVKAGQRLRTRLQKGEVESTAGLKD